MKSINVAAAIIQKDGKILSCQRGYGEFKDGWEFPGGKLEPGEAPELAAARELSEETGLTAGRMQYLGSNFTSPGYSEEVLHIYLARDLHRGAAHLDPGEFLNVERHPLEELVQMALDGELCDGKTTVALLKTQLLLARERGEAASGGL